MDARVGLSLSEPWQRLKWARERAGFENATSAANRFNWNENTYRSHENGTRDISRKAASAYAKAFKVASGWLLYAENPPGADRVPDTVPLVGYVSAGAEAHLFDLSQGPFEEVEAPADSTSQTVAVEIRGESLGSFFDRWLVFYDDVRRPVTGDMVGRLCVVGLSDGRILIKKLKRSKTRGLFHLLSQTEEPILDVSLEWAAVVKTMRPR